MKRNVEEAAVMVQKHREQFATSAFCPVSNDSSEFLIVVHRCYPFVFAWFFCVFPVFGWFVALWFCIPLRCFWVFFAVALLWFCFVFALFCCVLPVLGWFVALCSQLFSLWFLWFCMIDTTRNRPPQSQSAKSPPQPCALLPMILLYCYFCFYCYCYYCTTALLHYCSTALLLCFFCC